jgi:hypothetical protein
MATSHNTRLELEFVSTFVVRPKRARYSGLVVSPRLRPKFIATLPSFSDFDPRLKVRLSRSEDSSRGYLKEIHRRGADLNAYVISTDGDLDGLRLSLDDAIDRVHGRCDGTVIIFTSTLAYYEGALKYRFILDGQPVGGLR